MQHFQETGAKVFGISTDNSPSQKAFAARAVKWDLDTIVDRRMAYSHYFVKKS